MAFKGLHQHSGQSDRSVVTEAVVLVFGDRDNDEGVEAV